MGILGEIVKYCVINTGMEVGIRVIEKMETKSEENIKKKFNKPEDTQVLVICRDKLTWKDKFNIYDDYQNIKYSVKAELISIKPCLNIFDNTGKKIASVKEKLITFRSPISLESKPVDYILEIDGNKIGKLKSRWAFAKRTYRVDFNDWRIEGNILGWKYRIFNGNEQVANISQVIFNLNETYVINFTDSKDELLILMLVLAMAAINHPI